MAIKDWPLPIRRVIGWLVVSLTFAIAFAPIALILSAVRADEPLSWARLLGGYALVLTVPTTVTVAAFLARQLQRDKRSSFPFAVLMGTTVGLFVSLILGLVTGGYSLLSAPATGLLTFIVAWAFQPPKSHDS